MAALRKVTVLLPNDLLDRATRATGQGLTPTIRKGLEAMAATGAYAYFRSRRGKVKYSLNVEELREDR